MTRAVVGMAVLGFAAALPGPVAAQTMSVPVATVSRSGGEITLTVQQEKLVAVQTLTARSFVFTVSDGVDRVRVTGSIEGRITVQRAARTLTLVKDTAMPGDVIAIRAVLKDSPSLAAFDELMTSPWAQGEMPAATLAPVHALVALLRGNVDPLAAMIAAATATSTPRIVTVRQRTAKQCYDAYAQDVISYTYDYERCARDVFYTWNPFHLGWCAYEYNLKATMAAFWYLNCNGV